MNFLLRSMNFMKLHRRNQYLIKDNVYLKQIKYFLWREIYANDQNKHVLDWLTLFHQKQKKVISFPLYTVLPLSFCHMSYTALIYIDVNHQTLKVDLKTV